MGPFLLCYGLSMICLSTCNWAMYVCQPLEKVRCILQRSQLKAQCISIDTNSWGVPYWLNVLCMRLLFHFHRVAMDFQAITTNMKTARVGQLFALLLPIIFFLFSLCRFFLQISRFSTTDILINARCIAEFHCCILQRRQINILILKIFLKPAFLCNKNILLFNSLNTFMHFRVVLNSQW